MSMEGLPEYTPAKRLVHRYKMPAKLAAESGIESVGIQELTGNDENMAYKRATGGADSALHLAQASLVEINGKPVSLTDGSVDKAWNTMHPKVRVLVTRAYNAVNNPNQGELEDFLESHAVEVG